MNTIGGRLREGSLRPEEALEFARKLDRLAELARRLRDYAAASPRPRRRPRPLMLRPLGRQRRRLP